MKFKTLKLPEVISDWTTYKARETKDEIPFKSLSKFSLEDFKELFYLFLFFFKSFFKIIEKNASLKLPFLSLSSNESTYEQYLRELKNQVLVGIFKLGESSSFIVFDFKLADTILEVILGGEEKYSSSLHQFSELEIVSFKSFFDALIENKDFPWRSLRLDFNLERFGPTKVLLEQNIKTTEAIITFEAFCLLPNGNESKISISHFSKDLKIILNNLRPIKKFLPSRLIHLEPQTLEKTLVPITVNFAHTIIPAYELSQIRKGDVIDLKTKMGTYVKIKINDDLWLNGICGVKENKLAVKVLGPKKTLVETSAEEFREGIKTEEKEILEYEEIKPEAKKKEVYHLQESGEEEIKDKELKKDEFEEYDDLKEDALEEDDEEIEEEREEEDYLA